MESALQGESKPCVLGELWHVVLGCGVCVCVRVCVVQLKKEREAASEQTARHKQQHEARQCSAGSYLNTHLQAELLEVEVEQCDLGIGDLGRHGLRCSCAVESIAVHKAALVGKQ